MDTGLLSAEHTTGVRVELPAQRHVVLMRWRRQGRQSPIAPSCSDHPSRDQDVEPSRHFAMERVKVYEGYRHE
jgi:hypothetical protein